MQMTAVLSTPEGRAQMSAMLEASPMYQRCGLRAVRLVHRPHGFALCTVGQLGWLWRSVLPAPEGQH